MKCQTCRKLIPNEGIKINNDDEGLFVWLTCPHCKEEHLAALTVENFMTKSRWDDPSQWEEITPDQEEDEPDTAIH